MMLVGLGESEEDRIRQLFYLRQLRGLHHVRFSRYSPKTNGAFVRPRCSPWEVARVIAVARLILPGVQLGLAAGNSPDDIPLWFLAGGGNQLLGAAANRKGATGEIAITDRREIQQQFAASLGLQVGFECPTMENRI
jgi:biotin synthase